MSQTKYNSAVEAWVLQTKGGVQLRVKALAIKLHDRIVERTPVDTGRARASWNIVSGEDADLSVQPENYSGNADGDAKAKQRGLKLANGYVISNNLPYIEPLENGHSKQAPNGMVALALADIETGVEVFGNLGF